MCGIFGIYNLDSDTSIDSRLFRNALMTMHHRGPDANAVKTFGERAALGHVRLSIIDLNEESNQPFVLDDRYWMVYNGEIYNYIELREDLIEAGYHFRTSGDTEVLLRAYQHWGADCVNRFNGMWAFAIYDTIENSLFCSRDRFGIKPFNYALVDGQFIFASEIKAILGYFPRLKKPNYNVIANYCRTGVGAQHRETWFENIFRLEPAHNLFIRKSGIEIKRYWDYPRKINREISFPEALARYREILSDAVKIRMRSDVPIGFTLSSGLDSTSLVCLLKDHFNGNNHTYTAAFPGISFDKSEKSNFRNDLEINEPAIVMQLAKELNLEPTIITINYDNYTRDLEKIIYHLESGHSSPAIFPLFQILEVAKKDVTVVLEGQGADELLGGYISNVMPVYLRELISQLRFRKAYRELKDFKKVYSISTSAKLFIRQHGPSWIRKAYFRLNGIQPLFNGKLKQYKEKKDYPLEPSGFSKQLDRHLFKAHTGGLVNLLHYGDAISMAHTLESRLPYMDYRLVEFAFSLPSEYKVRFGMGKYIHRKAMENTVPEFILANPVKFGFESPLSHIFKEEGENSAKGLLLSERCNKRGLFSKEKLIKAFDEHMSGSKNHSRILFRLLSVELWFRLFIDN